jgi:hypothetical protein
VPAEALRLRRRVERRDRRLIALILTVSTLGAATALTVNELTGTAGARDCVSYDEAGVMGGGTWHLCGTNALNFCRERQALDTNTRTQCTALQRRQAQLTADP